MHQWLAILVMDIKMETEGSMRCTSGYPEDETELVEWRRNCVVMLTYVACP